MSWEMLVDLTTTYVIFTPAAVLFWYTTATLLDTLFDDRLALLIAGFAGSVAIAYCNDAFRRHAPTTSPRYVLKCYETAYDYAATLSGVCCHLGCRAIFDLLVVTGRALGDLAVALSELTGVKEGGSELLGPVEIAVGAATLLVCLGGFRNLLSLPFVVDIDDPVDRYLPRSTLHFAQDQFKDEVARIALIWIPMAVFKEATGRYFVGSDLLLDPYLTVGYGYLAAVLMTTVGRYVAVKLMTLIDSRVFKTAVEEVYVGISSVLTIALWKGLELCIDLAATEISSVKSEFGLGLPFVFACQLGVLMLLKWWDISRSLFDRGCESDGEGINFNVGLPDASPPRPPRGLPRWLRRDQPQPAPWMYS